jgi:hypothetical protein
MEKMVGSMMQGFMTGRSKEDKNKMRAVVEARWNDITCCRVESTAEIGS